MNSVGSAVTRRRRGLMCAGMALLVALLMPGCSAVFAGFTVTFGMPVLTQVSPNSGQQGQQNLSVAITGQYTHFVQGTTTASFGAGVTVASLTVNSATSATAVLNIDPAAALGSRNVSLTTGAEVVSLANGFAVTPGTPVLTQANPNTGQQGQQNLSVAITGQYTHFAQGSTTASFGAGITVNAVTVTDATHATANLSTDPAAAVGSRNVTVTTGTEAVTLTNGFAVTPGTPVLTQVNPSTGQQGQQHLSVALTGQYTHFAQASTTAGFGAGITVNTLTVTDATHATADVSIDPTAAVGTRNVTVTSGSEAVMLANGFSVTPGTPVLTLVNPNTGQQGQQNLSVAITGQYTHFAQGSTTASFGTGITVNAVTVTDATHATANLSIDPAAAVGSRNVSLTTGAEAVSLANGFTVTPGTPVLTQVNPNSGQQGQQHLSVALTGQYTHFAQGTTTASFGAGITVNALTVIDLTHATADVSIDPTAAVGTRNVAVTTGTEVVALTNGFAVTAGTPVLTQVSPSGQQGQQSESVSLTGQYTHWAQGTTTASFGAGISVTSLTVNSATSATAVLNIEPAAAVGPRNVTVITNTEAVMLTNGFAVTAGTPVLTQVNPNSGQQGQQSESVSLTGQYTHWAQGTTTASFGAGISVASLTVNSATSATAVLNIDSAATVGARNVTVTTGTEAVTLSNGFSVTAGTPLLLQVTPNSGQQGQQSKSVNLTGQYTHWAQGVTTADFGAGITVTSLTVNSPTRATAVLNIDPAAAVGPRNVTSITNTEAVTLTNGFTISIATPALLSITPTSGMPGQSGAPTSSRTALVLNTSGTPNVYGLNSALTAAGFTVVLGQLAPGQIVSNLTPDMCCVFIWTDGWGWSPGTPEDPSVAFNDADRAALVAFSQAHPNFIMDGKAARDYFSWNLRDVPALSQDEAVQLVKAGGGILLGAQRGDAPRNLQHVNQVLSWFGFNLFTGVFNNDPSIEKCVGTLCSLPHTIDPPQAGSNWYYPDVPHGLQSNGVFLGTAWFASPSQGYNGGPAPADDTFNGTTYPQVDHLITTNIGGTAIDNSPTIPLVITGQNTHFTNASQIDLGPGITVSNVAATDATHLKAEIVIAPTATRGARDLTVTTGAEVVTLANAFTVVDAPAVLAMDPDAGAQQDVLQITIVGENTHFSSASKIDPGVGITVSSLVATTPTELTATLTLAPDALLGVHNLTVTTDIASDIEVVSSPFTVYPGPLLVSMTPSNSYQGTVVPVTIAGQRTHFTNDSKIDLGYGITVSAVAAIDAEHLTAILTIPVDVGTWGGHKLTVTSGTEVVSLQNAFTVNYPKLLSVSPNIGHPGDANLLVTITGVGTSWQHVYPPTSVSFGYPDITVGAITVNSDTSLTVAITIDRAALPWSRAVSVSDKAVYGNEYLPNAFNVVTVPVITQVSPNSGQQGQQNLAVTITGEGYCWGTLACWTFTHFSESSVVTFSGTGVTAGAPMAATATSLTVPVTIAANASLGARDIQVVSGVETAALANAFTVTAGTPVITQLSPNTGQQGANLTLTITGSFTHFSSSSVVTFGGTGLTAGAPTAATATSLTVPVTIAASAPVGAQAIQVVSGGETVTLANAFTVTPGPTHFSVSAPIAVTAGTPFSFNVTALDSSGDVVGTYGGTVHFTSSDGQAVLPADITLANGKGTSTATLKTVGTQTISATATPDSSITGTSNDILVGKSCVRASGLGLLTSKTTPGRVTVHVPNSSYTPLDTGVRMVPIEGDGSPVLIPTPSYVNSCSSNPITGQTVCTANTTDIYLITDGVLTNTLTSGSTGNLQFSGCPWGMDCRNAGVAINPVNNTAYIPVGMARPSPYVVAPAMQVLDLTTNTLSPPSPMTNLPSENILVDPLRDLILSPGEDGSYTLLKISPTDPTVLTEYGNSIGTVPSVMFDSAAEDCETGIALATNEYTFSDVYITDLSQATYTSGTPGTWTAPGKMVSLITPYGYFGLHYNGGPQSSGFFVGGISVAPGSHLGLVTGDTWGDYVGWNSFTAFRLPSTSGSGTPDFVDYANARMPNTPDGWTFWGGTDPHSMTAYVSPNDGKAYGVIASWLDGEWGGNWIQGYYRPNYLGIIDLEKFLTLPRIADGHTVDPSIDLVAAGAVRYVATGLPELKLWTNPSGPQGYPGLGIYVGGSYTNFTQGVTTVSFGPGITTNSVGVDRPTLLSVSITIDPAAALGPRDVTVTTGSEVVTLHNGFTVTAGTPLITAVTPGSVQQGQLNVSIAITGQYTHFTQGTTTADFGAGVTTGTVTVLSPTSLNVPITIGPAAPLGYHCITVTTGGEVATFGSCNFVVTAGTSVIAQVSPNTGLQGQRNLNVTITGQYTNFAQGTSKVSFGAGITPGAVTVASPTSLAVPISIDVAATPGARDVKVTTGSEVATLVSGFEVTTGVLISNIDPNSAPQGTQALTVAITGVNTHFAQGASVVSFGPGVTVNSVTVFSATILTAEVSISSSATVGTRDITVTTGTEQAVGAAAFTVFGIPAIAQVSPNTGQRGQNLSVTITGQYTNFAQGISQVNFGVGITESTVAVASKNGLTAQITIDPAAILGSRTVTVTTGAEIVSLANGFTVAGAQGLTAVNPNTGQQGQVLPVAVTGRYTHFVQGSTTASFGAGITVLSLTVNSATSATAVLDIDPAAATSARSVTVATGTEVVTLANAFTVTAASAPPPVMSIAPNTALQGQALQVTITAPSLHFVQGLTQANFGSSISVAGSWVGTPGPVQVTSPTTAVAQISVSANAMPGPRTVIVQTGSEQASLMNGFAVTGTPYLSSISPSSGNKGQTLTVTIQGVSTNFQQGITQATFGPSISVGGAGEGDYGPVTVTGPETATALLTIDAAAATGLRNPIVQTGTEQASLSGSGFLVLGTVTGPPPVVAITSPDEDAEITSPTTVTGTVTSPNLSTWTLDYQSSGSSSFTTFATGTSANATGTFDPTLLLNGISTIRLTAVDQSGQTTSTVRHVVVTSNLKIGTFTLTFNDLTVPVMGMAIQILRTYDSRNKSTGDFGVGWTLATKTAKVEVNGVLGNNWIGTVSPDVVPVYCVEPAQDHVVSVTLPDGTVYKFQPTLNGACQELVPPDSVDMLFTPVGTTPANVSLTANNSSGLFVSGHFPGLVLLVTGTEFLSFDPDQFQLMMPDGRQLLLSRSFGLQSITDANGNVLTFGTNGISSSAGKGVSFQRDSQNRITTITDPKGQVRTYTYTANGDLDIYTDPLQNLSTFTYDTNHNLLAFQTPGGHQPIRNVYDDSGRLIQQVDTFGNVINFTNDSAANTETYTDALGHPTSYVYDFRGNIVLKTDALGGITQSTFDSHNNPLTVTSPVGYTRTFTYDANDNKLSETDALGHTVSYTYNSRNLVLTITDANGNVTTNSYDSRGNLLSITDANGKTRSNTYNSLGLLTSATDPLGNVTSYQYDSFGNTTQITDPLGNATNYTYDADGNKLTETKTRTTLNGTQALVTSYQYDALDRLIQTTYPDGSTTQVEYTPDGQKSATTDALGRRTTYQYDAMDRLVQTIYPDGTSDTTTYDAMGNNVITTDRAGRITAYTYDALNRLIQTIFPDRTSTETAYDKVGQKISTTDQRGNVTTYAYDAAGRQTQTTDALQNITTFGYDAAGNLVSRTDANGHTTQYQYDALNHRVKSTYADATFDSVGYDALGRMISKTDQAGHTMQFGYDALSRLTAVTDALGHVTTYAYDEVGERISQTDQNNHTTTFQYDQLGRRTARRLPLGQRETFAYDAAGNMASATDFNGRTTSFTYDLSNNLTAKVPDPVFHLAPIAFTYTATGKRASMTDATGTTIYSYDNLDRLTSKQTPQGTLTYVRDAAGNLTGLQAGAFSVAYTYDANSRLSEVSEASTGTTTLAYDAAGNLVTTGYPNGVSHNYAYDPLNHLTHLAASHGTANLASYNYVLDPAGRRLSVTELSGRRVDYIYDNIYRLLNEVVSGAVAGPIGAVGYVYDTVGNRTQTTSTLAGVSSGSFTYDANDRLVSETYDANGNTISSGGSANTYDFENRLVQQGGVTIVYDGDSNRVSKTVAGVTTAFLVDDQNPTGFAQVITATSSDGSYRRYVYGLERISQVQFVPSSGRTLTSYYLYDGHGSVRALSDATGTITDTYDYDAFGNLLYSTGNTPNNYLYSGEEYDTDLHLYYQRARYLNTGTGRFLTLDPLLGETADPISLHRYLYVGADPVNRVDPSGQQFSLIEINMAMVTQSVLQVTYLKQLIKFGISAARCTYCLINPGVRMQSDGLSRLARGTDEDAAWQEWDDGRMMESQGYFAISAAAANAFVSTAIDGIIMPLTAKITSTIKLVDQRLKQIAGQGAWLVTNIVITTTKSERTKELYKLYKVLNKGIDFVKGFGAKNADSTCKALWLAEFVSTLW